MKKFDTLSSQSVLLLLLLIAIAFVYTPGLNGPFVLDDATNIPQTKIDNLSFSSVSEVAFDNTSGMFGRPIPVATFSLNHYFGDGTPYAFKTTNLALHALNTTLIFVFVIVIISTLTNNNSVFRNKSTIFTALTITAIWSLHPIQVSTVMYSVQRMTILMTTFTVLALITYLKARSASADKPWKSSFLLLITGVFTILACLSKENGALIVLYVGLIELLIRNSKSDQPIPRNMLFFSNGILTLIAASLLVGTAFFIYKFDSLMAGYQIRNFTLSERLGTESNILIFYLKNILIPNITNMNLYLDDYPISGIVSKESLASYLILFSIIVLAILYYKYNPLVTFGILFFFLSHILESTVIPLELAFEHRNYVGTIGLSIAIVAILKQLFSSLKIRHFKYVAAILTIFLISFQTYSRNLEWSNDLTLHSIAVENNPRSERAKLSLAISLLKRSKLTEAVHLLEKAAAENDVDAHTHLHLLQFKAYGGVFKQEDYEEAKNLLASRPVTNEVVMILDNMLSNITNGIYKTPDINHVTELFQIATSNPNRRIVKRNQAVLLAHYSKSLSLQGKYDQAIIALQSASELNQRNPEIIIMMAEGYASLKQFHKIDATLSRIPTDIKVTASQTSRIDSLKHTKDSEQIESIEFTQSPE